MFGLGACGHGNRNSLYLKQHIQQKNSFKSIVYEDILYSYLLHLVKLRSLVSFLRYNFVALNSHVENQNKQKLLHKPNMRCLSMKREMGFLAMFIFATSLFFGGTASADLKDGLVAYYPFNGNANDESGNENDGEVNGATLTEDRFGKAGSAYFFDGIDGTIVITDNDTLELTNDFSISFFVLGFQTDHEWLIFSKHRSHICKPSDTSWMLRYSSNGFSISNNDTNSSCGVSFTEESGTNIVDDNWHHMTVVYGKSQQILKYFIDGNVTNEQQADINIANNSQPFIIGNQNGGNSLGALHAAMDDIRIYNRALSEDEIQELYHEGEKEKVQKQNLIAIGHGTGSDGWIRVIDPAKDYAHVSWVRGGWRDYWDVNGKTRPVMCDLDFDGKQEIIIGFGSEANGWIQIRDDVDTKFAHLKWVKGYKGSTFPGCN